MSMVPPQPRLMLVGAAPCSSRARSRLMSVAKPEQDGGGREVALTCPTSASGETR